MKLAPPKPTHHHPSPNINKACTHTDAQAGAPPSKQARRAPPQMDADDGASAEVKEQSASFLQQ